MEKLLEKLKIPVFGSSKTRFDPAAHLRMQADTINETVGELTGFDCPKCRNQGFSMEVRDNGRLVSVPCSCEKIRSCVKKMEKSGLKDVIKNLTFDSFVAEQGWQRTLKAGAERYAADPKGFLLFCGQPGSGKTHLCTAVCREFLLRGMDVEYLAWRDEIPSLKSFSDTERRQERLNRLKTCEVLYLDDLFKAAKSSDGSSSPTAADINLAFDILNTRYQSSALTIISTERTLEELVRFDEALGSRIAERAGNNKFTISRDVNRNYRLRGLVIV